MPAEVNPELLDHLDPDDLAEVERLLDNPEAWCPLPGPQSLAMDSQADEIYYGGQVGGGKTDLLIGYGLTRANRGIIFRREATQLQDLIDRSKQMAIANGVPMRSFNFNFKTWSLPNGSQLVFGGMEAEGDWAKFAGRAKDFYGFDELPQFSESQYRNVTAWLRSAKPGQRCRIIGAGNPPTDAAGEWVIRYWGPWLDTNTAKPGELRWFIRDPNAEQDIEVEGPMPVTITGKSYTPRSRTFIPASLSDNPYLAKTGYQARVDALPEPLRSILMGSFTAGRKDDSFTVIPTPWIRSANERWRVRDAEYRLNPRNKPRVTGLAVDVGGTGMDVAESVICTMRSGYQFDELIYMSKLDTMQVVDRVQRQMQATNCKVVKVDVIGVGSGVAHRLRQLGYDVIAFDARSSTPEKDRPGHLRFANERSYAWWNAREMLDPTSGYGLGLPPDAELLLQLAAPRWKQMAGGAIQVETKDDIRKRIGKSTDRADAIVMALTGFRTTQWVPQEPQRVKTFAGLR